MLKETTKKLVWDNDVCDAYNYIKDNLEEYDLTDPSDEEIWNKAYEEIDIRLGDEKMNLDIEKDGGIFLIGNYERWNGSYSVNKDLKTSNIGEALQKAISCWDGDNSFEIYVDKNRLLISQTGHDNPTNPSIMEFRVMKGYDSLDEFAYDHKMSVANIKRNSLSLGDEVRKVYGW